MLESQLKFKCVEEKGIHRGKLQRSHVDFRGQRQQQIMVFQWFGKKIHTSVPPSLRT